MAHNGLTETPILVDATRRRNRTSSKTAFDFVARKRAGTVQIRLRANPAAGALETTGQAHTSTLVACPMTGRQQRVPWQSTSRLTMLPAA
jgi:hypothetical protein